MDRHDSSGQQQPPGPPASLPGSWLGAIYLADISSAPHFGATLGNFAQSAARPRAVSVSSARHSDVNTQPPGSDHGTLPVHHNLGEPLLGSARSEPVSQRWTTPGPQTSSSLAGQAGSPASTGSWPARQTWGGAGASDLASEYGTPLSGTPGSSSGSLPRSRFRSRLSEAIAGRAGKESSASAQPSAFRPPAEGPEPDPESGLAGIPVKGEAAQNGVADEIEQQLPRAPGSKHSDGDGPRAAVPAAPARGLTPVFQQVQQDVQPEQEPELQQQTGSAQKNKLAAAIMVGIINAVITVPVMTSFAAIIFQDSFFDNHLGQLVKLVFLSSGVHQLVFSFRSTLPFAVGQVQDVGLIFLSAVATSVVHIGKEAGIKDEEILGTTLVTLLIITFAVGILIILTGTLKLASLVQYVPLPVVGGYLGYVGYFCFASGASVATGLTIGSPQSWLEIGHADPILKLLPALVCMVVLMTVVKHVRNPFALPGVLLLVPAGFYLVLLCMGSSLESARDHGWVTKPAEHEPPKSIWRIYELYNIHGFDVSGIYWKALPHQIPTALALFFVVAFGSSLDVAAIQQDTPDQLDYNRELVTVGFTGSYIFSQTIFTMRAGVTSRINGLIITGAMFILFAAPISVLEYVPNFFFGSLMLFIGLEIMMDWLVNAFFRVTLVEYGLLLLTFGAIMVFGLEVGIAAGIMLAALLFSYQYSKVVVSAFTVVPSRSGAVRTFEQRAVLQQFASRMVAVSLSGYIFFASSVKIQQQVLEIRIQQRVTADSCSVIFNVCEGCNFMIRKVAEATLREHDSAKGRDTAGELEAAVHLHDGRRRHDAQLADMFEGSVKNRSVAALAAAPRFLLLDFRRVQGLDATAARTFATLHNALKRTGVELILTHMPAARPDVETLLLAHGVIDGPGKNNPARCCSFEHMEAGLQFCEEQFLEVAIRYGLCKARQQHMDLAEVLRAHLELPKMILPHKIDYAKAADELQQYMTELVLQKGDLLFSQGDEADALYVVQSGVITCDMDFLALSTRQHLQQVSKQVLGVSQRRLFDYGAGGIVGELDFFLQRQRSFMTSSEEETVLLCLQRCDFERLCEEAPEVCNILQTIILRSTCLSASHALEALERSGLD